MRRTAGRMLLFLLTVVTVGPLLAAAPEASSRRAIVLLKEQAQLAGLDGHREQVIRRLQSTARRAQDALLGRLARTGLEVETRLWIVNGLVVSGSASAIAALRADPAVGSVEPDRIVPLPPVREEAPAQPQASQFWSVAKIDAPKVWADLGLVGKDVVVGHIDTGIDATHPDLKGKVLLFKDFVKKENTDPIDGQGHGTHTAGTIAGGTVEAGGPGVAPAAKLIVARVFTAQGASTATLLESMQWVMDPDGNPATSDGPRVVSNSWGSNSQTDKSFWQAVTSWRAAGIFPSFAAGNAGPKPRTVGIPGGYPISFAAGATDTGDGIASFSSRGPIKWEGNDCIKPEVSAPGHGVISCKDGGGYKSLSGTSMACPHVTGLVALLLSRDPNATVDQLESTIKSAVVDLGPAGMDNDYGTGRIDAFQACSSLSQGSIAGSVRGPDGSPVVAKFSLDGGALHATDAGGRYSVRVPDGKHVLVFSAYGFQEARHEVTVSDAQSVTLDVTLVPVPTGTITGRVVAQNDGAGLKAKVYLASSQVAPVICDASGRFVIKAPYGQYTLVAVSRRYGVVRKPVAIFGDSTVLVELPPAPAVLVVDASGQQGLLRYYQALLANLPGQFPYATHVVASQGPVNDVDLLVPHEIVVWFSGASKSSLPQETQAALGAYLVDGGRLLLTGQDISAGISTTAFFKDVLHAKLASGSMSPKTPVQGIGGDPVGHGVIPFSIQGGSGANNQTTPDALAPADDKANGCLRWQTSVTNRYAALRAAFGTAKVVYFGFGLEGVASDEMRAEVFAKAYGWLKPSAQERLRKLTRLTGEAKLDHLQHLKGWLGFYQDATLAPSRELVEFAREARNEPLARELVRRARK
ncbi:MAG: S8 family serine peptidase [Candidatus Riflebacteria bacterium]|nr:S8 family serine peptidase [Candidatus Riflebacteria bacterium]